MDTRTGTRSNPPPADDEPPWSAARRGPLAEAWWELRSQLDGLRGSGLQRVAMLVVAVGLVATAGWWLLRPASGPLEATIPSAAGAGSSTLEPGSARRSGAAGGSGVSSPGGPGVAGTTSTTASHLVVQAAGAVSHPGVYRLDAGARVDDLVRAAGGLRADADGDRVNLAAPLGDGERVWLPRRGESEPPDVVAGSGPGAAGGTGTSNDPSGTSGSGGGSGGGSGSLAPGETVDLNTATAAQLDMLPGVGPATAQAILAYRDANGPFAGVEDLLEVRGIGDAKLEQLRPLVTT